VAEELYVKVTLEAAADMEMVRFAYPVPAEFAAEIVAIKVPFSVAVPLIKPVEVLMLRPAGNPVAP
jgi:hypothetical protein